MARARRLQFSLAGLLLLLCGLSVLTAIVVQVHAVSQRLSRKADCRNNLKQLGNYLILYTSRYT